MHTNFNCNASRENISLARGYQVISKGILNKYEVKDCTKSVQNTDQKRTQQKPAVKPTIKTDNFFTS
jgi:hypothetical protein